MIEEPYGPQVYGNMNTIDVRVGSPLRREFLSVFPLFVESVLPVEYQLLEEAVRQGNVVVAAVGKAVYQLRMQNRTNARLLFLGGERVPGNTEGPVLSTSILVPGGTTIEIPQRFFSAEPQQKFSSQEVHSIGDPIGFAYVAGAAGLVVAAGRSIVAADLLDRPASCRKIWEECLREAASAAYACPPAAGAAPGIWMCNAS